MTIEIRKNDDNPFEVEVPHVQTIPKWFTDFSFGDALPGQFQHHVSQPELLAVQNAKAPRPDEF